MARKVGQIIARGERRWLIRVYLGRDHERTRPVRSDVRYTHVVLKSAMQQAVRWRLLLENPADLLISANL